MICHVLRLWIFGTLKKLRFWQNCEKVLNWLNSISWAEFHKGYVQQSRGKVTCRSHVQGACKLPWVIYIYKRAEFNGADFLKVKYKCQLIVRLKTIEYYKRLLCYLSFLPHTSGLLLIFVTALFIAILLRLQKVKKPRHFPWYRIISFIRFDLV